MAYSVNGKVYTDHALMDEVIYHSKNILNDIVLKNDTLADDCETEMSIREADYYIAIKDGLMDLYVFPLTVDMLVRFGYTPLQASLYVEDRSKIPDEDKDKLLKFCSQDFIDHYIEYNDYYRMLNGLPDYGTKEYDIYINPNDPKLLADDANTDFRFDRPLHTYSSNEINTLEALGIMDDIRDKYTGKKYKYLEFITTKKIDFYTARKAAKWDILYIPNVEYLVKSRFKELYTINRDIYFKRTYQEAYKLESDYYDEIMMIVILCQTLSDIITELPEWYIRRDVFDLRTVQYFLESQGVKFFKEIPLKYQIRIVKNLNKLIRYKSTNQNIHDILDIFGQSGTTVYKYYLFKKFLYTDHTQTIIEPELPEVWEMDDEYDFGDEELTETIVIPDEIIEYDFYAIEEQDYDKNLETNEYNFGNEDAGEEESLDDVNTKEEYDESQKIITDEYNNVYELEFIRTPIDESYDDYMKDNIYKEDYDTVTTLDKYWDGEDTHSYVKNQHLQRDFTIEGTKYMFLDYKVSMKEYTYQMSYFLSMIFDMNTDTDDITIAIPSIKQNTYFNLTDLCILLYCLSGVYLNKTIYVNTPNNIRTLEKPEFTPYNDYNGGMFFDNGEPEVPEIFIVDDTWEMDDEYDFGDEEVDEIFYDELYGEMYDFGYQNTIEDGIIRNYDFGYITPSSIDEYGDEECSSIDRYNFGNELLDNIYINDEGFWFTFGSEDDDEINMGDDITVYEFGYVTPMSVDITTEEGPPEPEPIPPPPPEPNWWDEEEFHDFDLILEGSTPMVKSKFRYNINGGNVKYSGRITQESYYEWMKSNHPDLFVPLSGRIYGFNLHVDMDKLKENVEMRHSAYSFEKGYTLEELGVESFRTVDKISSIEDMVQIYLNNTACYRNLELYMQDIDTRDKQVTLDYVFNTLFTVDYQQEFYRLKSGEIAETYVEILAERNYTLYKFYLDILKEKDIETRKDNIRGILNDITSTLEYYIGTDQLKYAFAWVPTNSLEAITTYIQLMINFFKSWKVYFLDPRVTFDMDDKRENKVGRGDMLTETKISQGANEEHRPDDSLVILPKYYIDEEYGAVYKEVIDIFVYREFSVDDIVECDGKYSDNGEEEFYDINGGGVPVLECAPFNEVDGGNVAARIDVNDLDGGGPIEMQEYLTVDGRSVADPYLTGYELYEFGNEEKEDTTLGNVSTFSARSITPYSSVEVYDGNNEEVSDRDESSVEFYDASIPTSTSMYEYMSRNLPYDVNGGSISDVFTNSNTVGTHIERQVISNDIIISKYTKNSISVFEDGVYLGGDFINRAEYEDVLTQLTEDRDEYEHTMQDYKDRLQELSNSSELSENVYDIYKQLFTIPQEVLNDYKLSATDTYIMEYTDNKVSELYEWFNSVKPVTWEEF